MTGSFFRSYHKILINFHTAPLCRLQNNILLSCILSLHTLFGMISFIELCKTCASFSVSFTHSLSLFSFSLYFTLSSISPPLFLSFTSLTLSLNLFVPSFPLHIYHIFSLPHLSRFLYTLFSLSISLSFSLAFFKPPL